MPITIVSEGKTTTEAIENGLTQLKVSKDMVDVKVLESEDKRSFFSILAPRVVKVELTVKENATKKENKNSYENKENVNYEKRKTMASKEEMDNAKNKINEFITEFFKKSNRDDVRCEIKSDEYGIYVDVNGDNLNYLIGYRGETMNAMQTILTSIASKYSKEKIKVIVNIENYREKREKSLEELAEKVSKTVMKTKKSITLEPMTPYERKIIHSKLQDSKNVKTYSIGVEPYRKVVIALK